MRLRVFKQDFSEVQIVFLFGYYNDLGKGFISKSILITKKLTHVHVNRATQATEKGSRFFIACVT